MFQAEISSGQTISARARLVIVPLLLVLCVTVGAKGQSQQAVQTPAASPLSTAVATLDSADASRNELLSYYEREAARLAEENNQLKGLYNDGLIARVELEASDKALVESRARLDGIQRQIAAKPTNPSVLNASAPSAKAWTTGSQRIDDLIHGQGQLYGVDPYLIYCVISQESSFRSAAVSPKGAQGLMQLMPATAARYGVLNPFDPAQSISGGTHYLKDLLELFNGRVDLALAAYNAGEGAVIKYGNRVPPYAETQSYVRLISMRYMKKSGS